MDLADTNTKPTTDAGAVTADAQAPQALAQGTSLKDTLRSIFGIEEGQAAGHDQNDGVSAEPAALNFSEGEQTVSALDGQIQDLNQRLLAQQQHMLQLQQQVLGMQQSAAGNAQSTDVAAISQLITKIQNLQVQNTQMASRLQQLINQRSAAAAADAAHPVHSEQQPKADSAPAALTTNASHVIKKGDTLWNIAKKYYGDGKKWRKILEANTKTLKSPNTLPIGSQLNIP